MAGLIPPATLEQIRAANDIVDVIGAVLPLKRAGANFVGLCPFHREKTPSFNVNPHRQIFHCFGCHKGGDVFRFVQDYENLTFIEAVRRLAERARIPLEFQTAPGQQQSRHVKETLLQMHEQIAQRWQIALARDPAAQIARDYLAQRGVSDEAVKLFRIGYAPDAWDDTVNWARSKGYEPALVEQGGLILRKEGTDRYYDRFRGRLMFPICDEQGRVIGFSGRVLSGDEKTAKYVNSPETPIFTKGKVFYGLDKSKRAILEAGFAVVCEGQLDLIACFMAGTRNVVAPQGTAFTSDHARILKRYTNEVVLCFDSDNAGQNAAVRVLDSLLASGLAIRVAIVPAPHDPDSFIKAHGGAAFSQLIGEAEGFFDFYLGRLCGTNDIRTDRGRLAVTRAMAEAVNKAGSPVLADTYAQKTALRLGVAPEAVRAEFKKTGRQQPAVWARDSESVESPPEETPPLPEPSEREFWLLRFILSHEESLEWVASRLDLQWIEHAGVRQVVQMCLDTHRAGTWHGVPALMDQLPDDRLRSLVTAAVAQPLPSEQLHRMVRETVQMLRRSALDRELAALTRRLGQPGVSGEEIVAIERRKAELRAQRRQPIE
ncbi:MAG TPA: DNA primase [Methylomirabilota bacterium]|nr:DNA primase [Methylomirabilota bacterium]